MQLYFRVENGVVAELFMPPSGFGLDKCMVPDLAAQFIALPETMSAPQPGWSATETNTGWAFSPPVNLDLPTAQKQQLALLSGDCAFVIKNGFSSSALGAANTYASSDIDQRNIVQSAQSSKGGLLACQSAAGVWSRESHTQAQAQQVLEDFVTMRDATRIKLVGYVAQVTAGTTVDAAQAIVWNA